MPTVERDIADMRVRRSFNGKLIIQIRRRCCRVVLSAPPELETKYEPAGLDNWRDADGNNAVEIAEVINELNKRITGCKS